MIRIGSIGSNGRKQRVWLLAVVVVVLSNPGAVQAQESDAWSAALALQQVQIDAIARAERSVVAITRTRKGSEGNVDDPDFEPNGQATGVIIDKRGFIVTAFHALGNPDENEYRVWHNHVPYKVEVHEVEHVTGGDPWTDLAVLKITEPGDAKLEPIVLGDAREAKKGQFVISLGDPYAIRRDGQVGASSGIISNLARRAEPDPRADQPVLGAATLHHYGTLIQTDSKLSFGTSGGPLINLKGEMIGLTTSLAMLARYQQNATFAIPVDDTFKKTIETLKQGRQEEFGFLGIRPVDLNTADKRAGRRGAQIFEVVAGTPAARARLQEGDVITHVAGKLVDNSNDLMRDLGRLPVQAQVRLSIQRPAEFRGPPRAFDVAVTLGKKYVFSTQPAYSRIKDPLWRGMRIDFSTAIANFYRYARYTDPQGCVAVVEVDPDSSAWRAGMRPSSFISHVGETRVSTPHEFHDAVAKQPGPVQLRLTADQGGAGADRTIAP